MIIYSVTVSIPKEIAAEWKTWMLDKHIPDVMNTGCFEQFSMQQLLDPLVDEAEDTYNIQYACPSMKTLALYQQHFAPALQAEYKQRYESKFTIFRTVLQRLAEG